MEQRQFSGEYCIPVKKSKSVLTTVRNLRVRQPILYKMAEKQHSEHELIITIYRNFVIQHNLRIWQLTNPNHRVH